MGTPAQALPMARQPAARPASASPPSANAQAVSYWTRSTPRGGGASSCQETTYQAPVAAMTKPRSTRTPAAQGSERTLLKREITRGERSGDGNAPMLHHAAEAGRLCDNGRIAFLDIASRFPPSRSPACAPVCTNGAANLARSWASKRRRLSRLPLHSDWHAACKGALAAGPASSEAFPFSRPRWAECWARCTPHTIYDSRRGASSCAAKSPRI